MSFVSLPEVSNQPLIISSMLATSDNYAYIASEIDDPSKDEVAVRSYAKIFWKRYRELEGSIPSLPLRPVNPCFV